MPLKFAYLGLWHSHAGMHIRDAASRPDEFQLVGVYEPDPEIRNAKLGDWAADMPDIPVFETIEQALDSDAEAIICEGRVSENLDYAERALAADKHVLLEKPAGVDMARLERLHDTARRKHLHLLMAYMWRYNPAIAEMIRLSRAGALGDLFYYRGHIPKPMGYHARLVEELDRYKGSLYFEMAGHLVDIMVTFMGKPQQVDATFGQFHGERKHVDNAVVVHRFDGGGLGTIDTASMHVESGLTRRIELYGTRGTAIHTPIGSNNLTLSLADAFEDYATGWQELTVPTPPGPPSLLTELAACISGAKEPDYTLDHDISVHRALFAGCGITDGSAMTDVPHSAKSI